MAPRRGREKGLSTKNNAQLKTELAKILNLDPALKSQATKVLREIVAGIKADLLAKADDVQTAYRSRNVFGGRGDSGPNYNSIPSIRDDGIRGMTLDYKKVTGSNLTSKSFISSGGDLQLRLELKRGEIKPLEGRRWPPAGEEYGEPVEKKKRKKRKTSTQVTDYGSIIETGGYWFRDRTGTYTLFTGEKVPALGGFFLFDRAMKKVFGENGEKFENEAIYHADSIVKKSEGRLALALRNAIR